MRPLLEEGHIYIACPPLFKLTNKKIKDVNKNYEYFWDALAYKNRVKELGLSDNEYHIQRYKGLGEMNADQLGDTTMNPANRKLIQVTLDNVKEIEKIASILMGDNAEARRDWISENIDFDSEENL